MKLNKSKIKGLVKDSFKSFELLGPDFFKSNYMGTNSIDFNNCSGELVDGILVISYFQGKADTQAILHSLNIHEIRDRVTYYLDYLFNIAHIPVVINEGKELLSAYDVAKDLYPVIECSEAISKSILMSMDKNKYLSNNLGEKENNFLKFYDTVDGTSDNSIYVVIGFGIEENSILSMRYLNEKVSLRITPLPKSTVFNKQLEFVGLITAEKTHKSLHANMSSLGLSRYLKLMYSVLTPHIDLVPVLDLEKIKKLGK